MTALCVNTGVKVLAAVAMCIGGSLVWAAGIHEAQSARLKFDAIETGKAAPGSRIVFSAAELNAWLADAAKTYVPEGARNVRMVLGASRATGYADIDFVRLRQAATGESAGWLMKNLFSGERPVRVTARFESRNGEARVTVERVEISGVAIEGAALDFAIDAFVRPEFPNAVVSEWFPLRYNVDHFTVNPSGVVVFIRR
jgi:hypothetical protein